MAGSSHGLPVVDFAPFLSGDPAGRASVARAVYSACSEWGFFYLASSGIPQQTVAAVFEQSRLFFARTAEDKTTCAWAPDNRGYVHVGRERLSPSDARGDSKECFNVGAELDVATWPDQPHNRWPRDGDSLRFVLEPFLARCHALCLDILSCFALSIGIEEAFFTPLHDARRPSGSILRLLRYPPVAGAGEAQRAGSHTDYGSITLLFQDDVGGLQVRRGDAWIDAVPIPGAIVVNTGDLMQQWSGGRLRSTEHRVCAPPHSASRDRHSVAYFCHPSDDTVVATLPCALEGFEAAPVTARDHLLGKLSRTY